MKYTITHCYFCQSELKDHPYSPEVLSCKKCGNYHVYTNPNYGNMVGFNFAGYKFMISESSEKTTIEKGNPDSKEYERYTIDSQLLITKENSSEVIERIKNLQSFS